MKNKILSVLLLLTVIIVGCKDNATSSATSGSATSKNSANSIIAYYNTFIDYDASGSKKISDLFKSDFKKLTKMVETKKKHSNIITWIAFIGIDPSTSKWSGSSKVNLLKAEDYLDTDNAKKATTIVTNMQDAYQKTKKAYLDFKSYYKNEDYKDDAWAQGATLIKIMEDNANTYFDNKDEFYTFFEPTISKAEEDVLADHPIRDEIIHAKRTLKVVDQINALISDEKTPIVAVEEAYSKLENRYNEGVAMNLEKLKEQKKDEKFSDFYEEVNAYLGAIRKAKRDGEVSNKDAKSMYYKYTNVIGDYNRFVK